MAKLAYKKRYPALILILLAHTLMAGPKIEFWNQQRKGANCFNAEPQEQWFAAAHELGLEWVRLTYSKWKGQQRDFLMGDADQFTGLVQTDLAKLVQVLDWAEKYDIKVVLTPLGLPGCRWRQNNNMRPDLRLWQDKGYWRQAAQFWREIAIHLKDHPAIYAYNIINEPTPEKGTGLAEDGPAERYLVWYRAYEGTPHDLPAFYKTVIQAIRETDTETPIMLDSGWYAQPGAFVHWPRIEDDKILYSFHMYEPYQFTSYKNFRDKRKLRYPGKVPYAGEKMDWNRQQIEDYFAPLFAWARTKGIPKSRLVNGEFGCYRRNDGCQDYLTDVIAVLNAHKLHWAFYSFREDEWDGMDYEVGTRGLGAEYWAAKEAGQHPMIPRHDNPLFDVMKREFRPGMDLELRRLVEALSSDEWRERAQAVETLGSMGKKARGVVGHLIERLADEQWHVRKAAAIALSRMEPVTAQAVPALITALADEEWHVRRPAAEALAGLGPASTPAVGALTRALEDEEWQVRKAAAGALAAIGPDAYPAIPQLVESLLDGEWQVRSPAALALGAVGPKAKPAINQLVYVMDDEEWKVRKHAAQALGTIGVPSDFVLSALRKATNDEEDQVRQAANQALDKLANL